MRDGIDQCQCVVEAQTNLTPGETANTVNVALCLAERNEFRFTAVQK